MAYRLLLSFTISLLLGGHAFGQEGPHSLTLNYDTLMSRVSSGQADFKTFSSRVKMVWKDGDSEQEFAGNIRMRKDSLIWMSLGIMGIEGMRLLITPDSIRILNKLADEYTVRDYSFLQQWLLFPVNFKMLQEIITGAKISIDERATMAGSEDSGTVLYIESEKMLERLRVDTTHYTLEKLMLKDKLLKQDLAITFEGYHYSDKKPFSHQRSIVIRRDDTTASLSMDFNRVNFDEELSYPFEVKEKMKREE